MAEIRANALSGILSFGCISEVLVSRLRHSIREIFRPTLEKTCEKGKPRSCAKAQVSRDTEAKVLKSATKITTAIAMTKIFVAAPEFVAW